METISEVLKADWKITDKALREMNINPKKEWSEITISELDKVADYLDVTVSELIENL